MTYIKTPFAINGDKTTVPETDVSGSVNFDFGYPSRYSQDPNTTGLSLDRGNMNYLFNIITAALKQYQENSTPDFISAADNGGVAFPYAKNAQCLYDVGGTKFVFMSLVAANTALPTDATKWTQIDPYNRLIERDSPAFTGNPTAPTQLASDNTTKLATTAFVKNQVAAIITAPIGSIVAYPFTAAPAGWQLCDGSVGATPELAALCGTSFGAAGSVPDLRGMFIRGFDAGRGVDAGRVFGTDQQDEFKSHTHSIAAANSTYATAAGAVWVNGSGKVTGASGGSETRPKNVALCYIIKY